MPGDLAQATDHHVVLTIKDGLVTEVSPADPVAAAIDACVATVLTAKVAGISPEARQLLAVEIGKLRS